MAINQDRSKSGILKHTITLGLNMCARDMMIAYGNDIPWGQIKITQNLDSHESIYTGPPYLYPEHKNYI